MDKKQLFRATSRATKFNRMHIAGTKPVYSYITNKKHEALKVGHTEYKNGKIYNTSV